MRKLCSVWIPHDLTDNQKMLRVNACKGIRRRLLEMCDQMERLYVTKDETWIWFHPLQTKAEN